MTALMVTRKSVRAWEDAYRKYGAASEVAVRASRGGNGTASVMAHASSAVASAWRAIAEDKEGLTWWMLAAVESAAEAFEDQARHWQQQEGSVDVQRDVVARAGGGRGGAPEWFDDTAGFGAVPGSGQPGDHAASGSAAVAEVRGVPSPDPRWGGAAGGRGRRPGGAGA